MAKRTAHKGPEYAREKRLEAVAKLMAKGTRSGEIDRAISRRFGVSPATVKDDRRQLRREWKKAGQYDPQAAIGHRERYNDTLDWLEREVRAWLAEAGSEGLAAKVRAAEALLKVASERARINGVKPPEEDDPSRGPVSVHLHLGAGVGNDGD